MCAGASLTIFNLAHDADARSSLQDLVLCVSIVSMDSEIAFGIIYKSLNSIYEAKKKANNKKQIDKYKRAITN